MRAASDERTPTVFTVKWENRVSYPQLTIVDVLASTDQFKNNKQTNNDVMYVILEVSFFWGLFPSRHAKNNPKLVCERSKKSNISIL